MRSSALVSDRMSCFLSYHIFARFKSPRIFRFQDHQLGGVEYAADHLGTNLVVVLGHTHCGAVGAALAGSSGGFIKYITDEIKKAVGDEKDELKASCLNVERSVSIIRDALKLTADSPVKVCGALYHIDSGEVEFLG